MPQIRHPLSNAIYDFDAAADEVTVTAEDGRNGRFTKDGAWLSGPLVTADPELARWISGPRLASTRHKVAPVAEHERPIEPDAGPEEATP